VASSEQPSPGMTIGAPTSHAAPPPHALAGVGGPRLPIPTTRRPLHGPAARTSVIAPMIYPRVLTTTPRGCGSTLTPAPWTSTRCPRLHTPTDTTLLNANTRTFPLAVTAMATHLEEDARVMQMLLSITLRKHLVYLPEAYEMFSKGHTGSMAHTVSEGPLDRSRRAAPGPILLARITGLLGRRSNCVVGSPPLATLGTT
jgi:hypothetical protein